jgi:hypothetical protein
VVVPVVDERQGHAELGIGDGPQQAEAHIGRDQQAHAAHAPQRPLRPPHPARAQRQHRGQEQGVGPQVEDEPQVAVDRQLVRDLGLVRGSEIALEELEVAAGVAAEVDHREIELHRDQQQGGEGQRRQEAQRTLEGQARRRMPLGHEPGGRAGDQEQQAHAPRVRGQEQDADRLAARLVEQALMVEDQPGEQDHAQPVEVGAAGGGRGGRQGGGHGGRRSDSRFSPF